MLIALAMRLEALVVDAMNSRNGKATKSRLYRSCMAHIAPKAPCRGCLFHNPRTCSLKTRMEERVLLLPAGIPISQLQRPGTLAKLSVVASHMPNKRWKLQALFILTSMKPRLAKAPTRHQVAIHKAATSTFLALATFTAPTCPAGFSRRIVHICCSQHVNPKLQQFPVY